MTLVLRLGCSTCGLYRLPTMSLVVGSIIQPCPVLSHAHSPPHQHPPTNQPTGMQSHLLKQNKRYPMSQSPLTLWDLYKLPAAVIWT